MRARNKVKPNNQDNELIKYAKERGIVFACILIDCIYISAWAIGVWATDKYIVDPLVLKGVDKLALGIFQWVSGIATLLTLIVYTVRDVWFIAARTWSEMKEVKNVSKKKP
jgi:hypothetical protein